MNIIQCAYCKSLIPEKSRFCGNCGRMLEGPGQEIEQQALASEAQFFLLLGGSASPLHGNVPVAQGTPQIDGVPFFRHGAKVQRGFRLTFRQAAISGAAIVAIIGAAVAAILLPQLVGSHAQSPLPGLFLSGNIVPGGIVSLHGSGFSSGGTVTITVDGHPVTIVSSSSLHQASYDGRSLASLPFITSRTTTVSPSATGVSVGNDGRGRRDRDDPFYGDTGGYVPASGAGHIAPCNGACQHQRGLDPSQAGQCRSRSHTRPHRRGGGR